MDFVRKVVNSTDLINIIDLPNSLINRKVEILIIPIDENKKKSGKKKNKRKYI